MLELILIIAALLLLGLAAIGVPSRINLGWAGLFLAVLAFALIGGTL